MTDKTATATATGPARRKFLGAGVAGAAALTAPMISVAQSPIVLKMQGAVGRQGHLQRDGRGVRQARQRDGGRPPAHRLPGRRRGGEAVRGDGRDQQGRARRQPRRAGVLVRQEQGRLAVRLGPDQRLRRAPDAGLDLSRRRPGALQRAARRRSTSTWSASSRCRCRPSRSAGSRSRSPGRRGAEGPQVPHRRPGGRPVPGDGRQGDAAARRRDHPGAGEGRDRRLRVQQPDLGHALRRAGRDQELHDGQLPPGDGVLRDRLQQEEVGRDPEGPAGDPAVRRRGGELVELLDGDGQLLARPAGPDGQAQGQRDPHAEGRSSSSSSRPGT